MARTARTRKSPDSAPSAATTAAAPASANGTPGVLDASLDAAMAAAAQRLAGAHNVWIGTHIDPDGDAVGSLLGLGWILADAGHNVFLACQDPSPAEFDFLPGVERIMHLGPAKMPLVVDLAVAVDAADAGRLGALYDADVWQGLPSVVFDHHVSNPGFGNVNVIDPTAASTAEVILGLADAMGVPVGIEAATCLLTGILTDTIGFRTGNTTAATLDRARRLIELGAPLATITKQVFYSRPLASLQLIGRILSNLRVEGPFAIAMITQADLAEFGVSASETRDITAFLATAAEPAAIALVREREDGQIDVSLRSHPGINLLPAAIALGGGGHPQAAGARLPGPIEHAAERVLAALGDKLAVPMR